jgi:hypothetical protein
VLAVAETTAGEQDRQIGVVVDIGIAHIAAKENHGSIEQARRSSSGRCGEAVEQSAGKGGRCSADRRLSSWRTLDLILKP